MKRNNINRLTFIVALLLISLFTDKMSVIAQPPLRRTEAVQASEDADVKRPTTAAVRSAQRPAQRSAQRPATSKSSKATPAPKKKPQSTQLASQTSDRASLMFPTSVDVPTDVNWKRDVYRNLDLTLDANAPLYFPVEPTDGKVNLFTLLFKLFSEGKIPVYNVPIETGIEDFRTSNRAHFKDFLENNMIDYEVQGSKIVVSDADLAAVSENVLQIKIKESSYYDQNTATFHSRVVALCPVLCRTHSFDFGDVDETAEEMMSDDEGGEESEDTGEPTMANEPVSDTRRAPLFWVKMEDVAPYLAKSMIMLSNYNNAASCSMLDFFDTNKYKGSIFMTTNMQNRILVNDVKDPKKLKDTQNRIEKELVDFEKHIWTNPADSIAQAKRDSIAAAQSSKKISKARSSASRIAAREESAGNKREKKSKSSSSADKPAKAAKAPKASSGPRVSARRQRH